MNEQQDAAGTPLYQKMVRELRKEIVRGVYPVGTLLPSESKLMERFSVSRHTVRAAVRALRDSGLVSSRQGLGTIVSRPGDGGGGYIHQVNTISDLFPRSVVTQYDPVEGNLVKLPDATRFLPELQSDALWLRIGGSRTHPGGESPFNEFDVFVAARFAGVGRVVGTQSGPIHGSIEALYGEAIGEVTQIFGGFVSDSARGKSLGMRPGEVGIEVKRVFWLASSGEIAMISINRYLPGAFSYSMTLRKVRA